MPLYHQAVYICTCENPGKYTGRNSTNGKLWKTWVYRLTPGASSLPRLPVEETKMSSVLLRHMLCVLGLCVQSYADQRVTLDYLTLHDGTFNESNILLYYRSIAYVGKRYH